MKKTQSLIFLLSSFFVCSLWAQEFQIKGFHSQYGAYLGRAVVVDQVIQKNIRFVNLLKSGSTIETIWSGRVTNREAFFELKYSQLLTSYNGVNATDAQLQKPTPVSFTWPLQSSDVTVSIEGEGQYNERWTQVGQEIPNLLWIDQREILESTGNVQPWIVRLARVFVLDKVIEWFRAQPITIPWRERQEFKEQRQYSIRDKTDAEFYIQNPNTLRITNKTINPFSLAEAEMRRNAYGKKLFQKAAELGRETTDVNLNVAGLLELAEVNSEGRKIQGRPEWDSALWTAMFGWAEFMRYDQTKNPEAFENFHKVLSGILTLVEITEDPKQFARTIAVSPSNEDWGPNWVQGNGTFSNLKWLRHGNNDMVKGVFLVLTLAAKVIKPEEKYLWDRIRHVVDGLNNLESVGKTGGNAGVAYGIKTLYSRDLSDLNDFEKEEQNILVYLQSATGVESGFYFGGEADWSGVHLTTVSNSLVLLISQQLNELFPSWADGYQVRAILKRASNDLVQKQRTYAFAPSDFISYMTYALVPDARREPDFLAAAKEAVWSLKEMPSPRRVGDGKVELQRRPEWSLSAWPRVPWKLLTRTGGIRTDKNPAEFTQGAYRYPLFEGLAWQSTYLWKDSGYEGDTFASPSKTVIFSADYLVAYWAARSSGLIKSDE